VHEGRLRPPLVVAASICVVRIFDGHNDALLEAEPAELANGRDGGHLDVPRALEGGLGGGMFAVFTPNDGGDPYADIELKAGGYDVPLPAPVEHADALARATVTAGRLFVLEAMGAVRVARGTADLDAADRLVAVLHLEGAEAIAPDLGNLATWYEAGLRSLGPVWSRPNHFGHGVPFRFPSSPDTGPGLTAAGRELVRQCNALGIVVDVSHLNEAGFWDVANVSRAPLVASHSGAHALCASSRNLTDEQLSAIGATGGLVGVVFATAFVRDDGADEDDTPLSTIVAHVRHIADRIGVDHVALGSDFDGARIPAPLGDVTGLPRLLDALVDDGFSHEDVAKIAWWNWRRVLGASWAS
jgi:membrane dipeptidase